MVTWPGMLAFTHWWLIAQAKTQTALERMTPAQRARVLAALAAFIILGLGMMALVWLGARVTRRYMNQEPLRRRDPAHSADDWSSKPLHPQPRDTDLE